MWFLRPVSNPPLNVNEFYEGEDTLFSIKLIHGGEFTKYPLNIPAAEHRYCLRHIYENMRKKWRTREYKDHLWKCATASTMQEFSFYMKEFSKFDKAAFEWLKKIDAHHWARSHFSGRAITDMLLNNLCEVFNRQLIDGRDKPIITCLEYIREYCMKRICNVVKVLEKCVGPLTPSATKILDANVEQAAQYTVRWSGKKYQVRGPWEDQHVVDLNDSSCSCRKWELTGIPCKHVIATLNDKADNGEQVGELYTYVHKVHWLKTWKEAYTHKVDPIKGRTMWPENDYPIKITPPEHKTQPGRPQKKRMQSAKEKIDKKAKLDAASGSPCAASGSGRLTRKYITVTCSKCGNKGHNSRTCKGQGGLPPTNPANAGEGNAAASTGTKTRKPRKTRAKAGNADADASTSGGNAAAAPKKRKPRQPKSKAGNV